MKFTKMFFFTTMLSVLMSLGLSQKPNEKDELLLLQIVFRHADRTPIGFYAKDPYKNYTWVEGRGELTLRGKERSFQLGEVLRRRYGEYLENVPIRNVEARSSTRRRCIETTAAVLAGFLPPKEDQVWSCDASLAKMWQPIAVNTVEKKRDWLLVPESECPAADKAKEEVVNGTFMQQFLKDNNKFMKELPKYTGDQYDSWIIVAYLYDTLLTEEHYFGEQFRKPEWLDQMGNDTLERLEKFYNLEFTLFSSSTKYLRYRIGSLLKQLMLNINSTIQSASKERSLYLYGTHDNMLSYLLAALGLPQGIPTYASAVIFELRRSAQPEPYLNVLYLNGTDHFSVRQLPINQSTTLVNCPKNNDPCSYSKFNQSLLPFLPGDIEKECAQ